MDIVIAIVIVLILIGVTKSLFWALAFILAAAIVVWIIREVRSRRSQL
jgi:hypothetical protein